jgi:hypothetical protein
MGHNDNTLRTRSSAFGSFAYRPAPLRRKPTRISQLHRAVAPQRERAPTARFG